MGFPTHLLADDEELVLVLRRHIKVIAWPILLLLLILALVGASFLLDQPLVTLIAAGIGLLAALRWVLWPIVVWWNEIYVLTTKRLILRRGVFNRSGHDMPLSRLNEVSFEHSLIERMLGCGTLKVENASDGGPLVLTDIPKVELVQRSLYELADDLRGVRGGPLDASVARNLDEAFDDEYRYRGPAAADTPEDPRRR
ncbi:PH domain-containing protein [Kineosporia babensis]|uniref:PH domain-containing protein n=1 Tax=Kineosporia babensis TaxID=499548 RepID=A0A9X1T195_9ACTN|nr:PH domain-containing protein [Kineosporia babensis]MCD5313618.1 PH domain-containing protein [Kineosporia babensis]